MTTTKFQIGAAILFGFGASSLLILGLNLSRLSSLAIFLGAFLLPGSLFSMALVRTTDFGNPLLIFAGNAIFYSALAYLLLVVRKNSLNEISLQRLVRLSVLPVALLSILACIPALNPLWARGIVQLTDQRNDLSIALSPDIRLSEARTILRSRGISFYESPGDSEDMGSLRGLEGFVGRPGDIILSARYPTSASQFPCGYDMEIVLAFGKDGKQERRYINPLRICP